MYSLITLGIGRLELDWGKNSIFTDHSVLFKTTDIKQITYYYANCSSDDPIIMQAEGYSRRLADMKRRLDLLGYDLESIKKEYEDLVQRFNKNEYVVDLPFKSFYSIIYNLDLSTVDILKYAVQSEENGYSLGEYARKCVFPVLGFLTERVNDLNETNAEDYYQHFVAEEFFENIDPYITLRILAENPQNCNYEVYWAINNVLDSGWITRNEIVKDLPDEHKILVVTEGSSDTNVLRKTIDVLYSDISDFFTFIDMKENYPFTGVGELYKFCEGLCKISIRNNVIVIFDNDTAGLEKFHKSDGLQKPNSFLILKLPDHKEFDKIKTVGPQGESIENINGSAVAIECFLDFRSVNRIPVIRWTGYNYNEKSYQGELEKKDYYVRAFMRMDIKDESYDTSKLEYLVDYIISKWINRNRVNRDGSF